MKTAHYTVSVIKNQDIVDVDSGVVMDTDFVFYTVTWFDGENVDEERAKALLGAIKASVEKTGVNVITVRLNLISENLI